MVPLVDDDGLIHARLRAQGSGKTLAGGVNLPGGWGVFPAMARHLATPVAATLVAAAMVTPAAQSDTRPSFAVATIKYNRSGDAAQGMRLQPGGRIVVTNQPLRRLIIFAYGLQPQQLAGGPSWLDSDRFDITAQAEGNISPTPPGGPPGPAQLMLQRLLTERFGLVVHTEAREMPVYALTVARGDGQLGRVSSPRPRTAWH